MATGAPISGEVAEWSNVPDSKSGEPQGSEGSNPSLSSRWAQRFTTLGLFFASFSHEIKHLALSAANKDTHNRSIKRDTTQARRGTAVEYLGRRIKDAYKLPERRPMQGDQARREADNQDL